MKKLFIISTLIVSVLFVSCNSKSADEIKANIEGQNESCPINYKGVGEFEHFECDTESKTIKINFALDSRYMTVEELSAISEDTKVTACIDLIQSAQTYIDWAEEGYSVDLTISDDSIPEGMKKTSWNHVYSSDYLTSAKEDFELNVFGKTLAELIAFNYANTTLASQLPKETKGPWIVEKISTEYDYIDIYYKCTEEGADDPSYFNIFMVDGEDDQKMLGGGEELELTRMEMQAAFREGKTVRVGGDPLFALDFLYKCEIPARYHFEPLCTIVFRDQ